jgi:hypothetical protein
MRMEVRVPKERINLLLERVAIERARRYSELHGTSISSIVSEFLAGLPTDDDRVIDRDLTPTVRRLLGIGSPELDRGDYRDHLAKKHGV